MQEVTQEVVQTSPATRAEGVFVVFQLEDATTTWGERIRVVGDVTISATGTGWIPEKAALLTTDEEVYPRWRSGEVRLRCDGDAEAPIGREDTWSSAEATRILDAPEVTIRYKYVRDRSRWQQGFIWEDKIENREVTVQLRPGTVWEVTDSCFNIAVEAKVRRLGMHQLGSVERKVATPPVAACDAVATAVARVKPRAAVVAAVDGDEATTGCRPLQPAQSRGTLVAPCSFDDAYEMLSDEPFASGGFSSVWRCRLRGGGRAKSSVYAVKRVAMSKLSCRGRMHLLGHGRRQGEIHLHKGLHHPNIVRLLEVFDDTKVVSLVMECCEGGDLLELVLSHREKYGTGLPERGAAVAMKHLFGALAFLHGKCIVHRDVKCENVFQLEARGSVSLEHATYKLGDFGLAMHMAPGQVVLEQVGSPSTSAPEVVLGRPYGMPADIWSAGATLFTALAARRPFEAVTYRQMLDVSAREVSFCGKPWQSVSIEARDLLEGLLHSSIDMRPTAEVVLAHPWLLR